MAELGCTPEREAELRALNAGRHRAYMLVTDSNFSRVFSAVCPCLCEYPSVAPFVAEML